MIGVLVRFRYDADFDEQRIRKAAQTAQSRFVGLPGLRSKAFTRTAYRKRERSRPGSDSWTSSVRFGPILLKNSPPKFGRKNYGHEKSITMEFLSATTFKTTLVVKRFLKKGTFLSAERAERVFQQNRPEPDARCLQLTAGKPTLKLGNARDDWRVGVEAGAVDAAISADYDRRSRSGQRFDVPSSARVQGVRACFPCMRTACRLAGGRPSARQYRRRNLGGRYPG